MIKARDLTIVCPYYRNRGMLAEQYRHFSSLPSEFRERLRLIIVDDCSPEPAMMARIGFALSIFRIEVDVRWNQDAARNIGMKHARTDWCVMIDIDHLISWEALHTMIFGYAEPGAVYRFRRKNSKGDGGKEYKPHPNTWFLERSMFERAGGYDERFAGWYGTDADFAERLIVAANGQVRWIEAPIVRYSRDVIPDASTPLEFGRKSDLDRENIRRIKAERMLQVPWKPLRYQFPYHQVV